MGIELKAKLFRSKNSVIMVIPQPVVEALSLNVGSTVSITLTDHTMEVRKKV